MTKESGGWCSSLTLRGWAYRLFYCEDRENIAVAKAALDSRFHPETLTTPYASLLPPAFCPMPFAI